ncbi:hypothetical protein BDN72DRAFT_837492 [Pluteus cervinus]|uniref:Uncharacterized protein n=1 Tax=Pluteus cervinus TaxID=181527 RepID=A0ACD3B1X4_9AGAR|nr:hypothetical protein BDN72DRAFT_837492 [Pluteus cervinus]
MVELQPELVDIVLKQLITIDTPLTEVSSALLSCCLVSHTWRAFAQPLLFSEVLRRSSRFEHHSERLIETLSRYEYLNNYVKSLSVDVGDLSEPSRSCLLKLIPRVQELVVVAPSSPIVMPDSAFAELWVNSTPFSCLTTLCLQMVDMFPIDIFYHVPALKRLHLIEAGMSGFSGKDGTPNTGLSIPRERPKLTDLYIFSQLEAHDMDILAWFLHPQCAFDLSDLSTCHVIDCADYPVRNFHRSGPFLQSVCTPKLRNLGFAPPSHLLEKHDNLPIYEAFRNLPNLQSVKLVLEEPSEHVNRYISVISWVALYFLPKLSHPERLQELLIPLSFCNSTLDAVRRVPGWDSLDAVLGSEGSSFRNLDRVHFALLRLEDRTRSYIMDPMMAFQPTIPLLLPCLSQRGLLQVGLSPLEGYISENERRYESPIN